MPTHAPASPYSEAFFDGQVVGSLNSARIVLEHVWQLFKPTSVVDVGCGVAPWLRVAADLGAADIVGVDGDYVQRDKLLVDPACFYSCDLEQGDLVALLAKRKFDLVMNVEVAEHLTPGRAQSFVSELCSLGDLILFSAAVPGQGGVNHFNEQWPGYWSALFDANGFDCFDVLRPRLWEREECEWWYLQNVLLFARRDTASWSVASALGSPQTAPPMSLVHPRVLPHVVRYASDRIIGELAKHHPFGRSTEVGHLEKKLEQMRVMVDSRGHEIRKLQSELEAGRREIQLLQGELEAARGDIRQSEGRLEAAQQEVGALRESTSWRITSPLRRATRLLRR